jgi:tRNA threonylcarbamoyl adenosine modification protein (Sua5/YciO/YrdC/YwlC family)
MAAVDVVERAIDAIRRGASVLLPTDTVYGLCAAPTEEGIDRAYAVKGRVEAQPTAVLAADVDRLLELVPELRGEPTRVLRALLPGPYTLVLPNPAHRFPRLTGARPDTIGVRVANLPVASRLVLDAVGCVLATSANAPGDPSPASLADVPDWIRSACEAEIDAGRLPGVASTVLDLTGHEPVVLREGTASAADAIALIRAAPR